MRGLTLAKTFFRYFIYGSAVATGAYALFIPDVFAQLGRTLDSGESSDVDEVPDDEFDDGGREANRETNRETSRDRETDELVASEEKELALSDAELRGRHNYGTGLFLGEVVPWATAGFEAHYLASPYRIYTLSGGGGSFEQFGKRTELRSVDVTATTKAIGFGIRWYHVGMPQISLQASTTYVVWKGKASPHGANADEGNAAMESLSSGFDATSTSLGVGLGVSKVWQNGFYFDWLPVGLKKSAVLKQSFSRPDSDAKTSVSRFIERHEVFGFINLRFGCFF